MIFVRAYSLTYFNDEFGDEINEYEFINPKISMESIEVDHAKQSDIKNNTRITITIDSSKSAYAPLVKLDSNGRITYNNQMLVGSFQLLSYDKIREEFSSKKWSCYKNSCFVFDKKIVLVKDDIEYDYNYIIDNYADVVSWIDEFRVEKNLNEITE